MNVPLCNTYVIQKLAGFDKTNSLGIGIKPMLQYMVLGRLVRHHKRHYPADERLLWEPVFICSQGWQIHVWVTLIHTLKEALQNVLQNCNVIEKVFS